MKPIFIGNLPRYQSMAGHHTKVPIYLDGNILPNCNVKVAALDLGAIPNGVAAAPHSHDSVEIYLIPSYPDPVKIVVNIDGITTEVTSPAVVWIPARAVHQFKVIEARIGQFIFGLFPENTTG